MKTCTITHDATGIRLNFGNGTILTYANQAYVAEALAYSISEKADLAMKLAKVREAAMKPAKDADELHTNVMNAIDGEVPF